MIEASRKNMGKSKTFSPSSDLGCGQSMYVQAEIRTKKMRKSLNLAWAVRISGDGGQEGRHLAKKKRVAGPGDGYSGWTGLHADHEYRMFMYRSAVGALVLTVPTQSE